MDKVEVAIKSKINIVKYSKMINWSVRYLVKNKFGYNNKYEFFSISDFLHRNKNTIQLEDHALYSRVTIRLYNKGVQKRDEVKGENIGTKKQYLIKSGQFIISKIDARNGAFGIVPEYLNGAITTADFLSYYIDVNQINPYFLKYLTSTKQFLAYCQSASSGTTGRQRINEKTFLNVKIPLPPLNKQNRIVEAYKKRAHLAKQQEQEAKQLGHDIEEYLFDVLGIKKLEEKKTKKGLQFVSYKILNEWGINRISDISIFASNKFNLTSFLTSTSL